MSLVTSKLDYARIRNAQRKVNKSIYELKDATNIHNNDSSRSEALEMITDPSSKKGVGSGKEEESQNTDDFANLFGQNFCNGNLEYITSLISNNKATSNNNKNRSNSKGRTHLRAKSTLMGSSNQSKIDQSNNENIEPVISAPSTQNVTSVFTGCGTTQASSLKPDIDYESTIFQIEIEKEPTPRHNFSQRNPNNTPAIKEERLFDNFFKKGGNGMIRRSMSLEDLRLVKKIGGPAVIDEETSQGYSPSESKLLEEKTEDQSHRPNMSLTSRGDFMTNLNSYINYFDKSETTTQKEKQKMINKYFVNQDGGKANQFLKKELEIAQNEVRNLKRHHEGIQGKILDLVRMNKHLIKELNDVKIREEEYQQRIKGIENQFLQLNQRKEHYKAKYLQTQELLDIERIDNENNLVVLKKILASNINHALDPKGVPYNNHTREKIGREKDHLKNMLKEVIQNRKDKDLVNMARPKDKRTPLGNNISNNNRYDPQYNKKLHKNKDISKYNLSTISQKAGLRSEDDDFLQDENNNPSEFSERYGNLEESDEENIYQEHFTSENYEKKLTKEQQIRLLQDRLAELAGGQEPHQFAYEKGINQKSVHKAKHKALEPNIQNYFAIREKEKEKERKIMGYSKMSNLPLRYDHHAKHKNRNDIENDVPNEIIHNFRSQNDSD